MTFILLKKIVICIKYFVMPRYHKLGKIPHKRHTTFKKENGGYHYEELLEQLVLMACLRFYIIYTDQHRSKI